MSHNKSRLAISLALLVAVLIGCQCGGAGTKGPGIPGNPAANPGDPAEQAAIETVKKHGGLVTHDETQPNRPVIAVNVYKNSFTDADLKELASLTKARKMSL